VTHPNDVRPNAGGSFTAAEPSSALRLASVDFRVFVEPQQGATYADQLAVARAAESLGYSAFFRSDHYVAMSGDGLRGPTKLLTCPISTTLSSSPAR
jgi:hypothetical protein